MSRRLKIGELLADYRIVGFLGAGGMGSVYHGVHTKIDRPVAIKVLSDEVENSSFRERFFNEARLQSRLHHPNIATLYDLQESGELVYIVMEFVDGETLDGLIKQRYFAVEEALKTFETICEAVAFIHGNNIVHRDIKPQNIKMSSTGTIKMLDFGIAKGAIDQGLTRVGGVVGTPKYLSPEQLRGHEASAYSDIWSLGILFYEMLTGTDPFKGGTLAELTLQITNAQFEPPEKLNPAIPADVAGIVNKCLTVDTSQRYQRVTDLISDVRKAQLRFRPKPSDAGSRKKFLGVFAKSGSSSEDALNGEQVAFGGDPAAKRTAITIASGLALAVVLFAALGVGLWAISGSPSANTNTTERSRNEPLKIPEGPSGQKAGQTAQTQGQHSVTSASSDLQRVTVDTTEGTAQVYRNGELVGTTPYELEGREDETVSLTLKRNGYEDLDVQVDIRSRKKVNTFSLKRK